MQTNDLEQKRLILVCNDDGIDAEGIAVLAETMDGLGDIYVVAPVTEQSASGHSITYREPVRAHPWAFNIPSGSIQAFAVTGTPADCVKIAVNHLLPRKPDLVVSGINQGPNTAVNILYSGTVSAAVEAAILGIDAIAFSLCAWEGGNYDTAAYYARKIAENVLQEGLPEGVLLNVNIPAIPKEEIKGIAATRLARSRWEETFSKRIDPFNQPYYWISGTFVNLDDGDNNDLDAVEDGYVSITPIHYDLTAYDFLDHLRTWDWETQQSLEQ